MYKTSNTYGRIMNMTKSNDYKMLLTMLCKSFSFSERDKSKEELLANIEYLSMLKDIMKEVKLEFSGTERGDFLNKQLINIGNELEKEREVLNAN